MRTRPIRSVLSAALGVVLALTVSGCSGGSGDAPEPRAEETVEQAEETEAPVEEEAQEPVEETDPPAEAGALDEYVELERAQIPTLMELFDGLYSDIQIDPVHPGTVEFTYTFSEQLDAEAAVAGLSEMTGDLQQAGDQQVFPAMKKVGIAEPSLRCTYLNADGSEIWTHLVEPS